MKCKNPAWRIAGTSSSSSKQLPDQRADTHTHTHTHKNTHTHTHAQAHTHCPVGERIRPPPPAASAHTSVPRSIGPRPERHSHRSTVSNLFAFPYAVRVVAIVRRAVITPTGLPIDRPLLGSRRYICRYSALDYGL